MSSYDYLIVGAGLAGLHSALCLSHKYPKAKIAITEQYNYVGGRVVTYHPKEEKFKHILWENGAGRIHESHKKVLKYVKKYNLTLVPLSDKQNFRSSEYHYQNKSAWKSLSYFISTPFSLLPKSTLATHTLSELIKKFFGYNANAIMSQFPYWSELYTMRADMALESMKKELGYSDEDTFFVVKEGLSEMIRNMREELEKRGVEFLFNTKLLKILSENKALFQSSETESDKYKSKNSILTFQKCILAIHSEGLKSVQPFSQNPILQKLKMEPLLRCYAIFPKTPWILKQTARIVSDDPLRFFIPVNPKEGIFMISYTDGKDARKWLDVLDKKGEKELERSLLDRLKKLFPDNHIPKPLFFKAHPWYEGCTYWTPGLYSPTEYSEKIMNPFPYRFPNVYVCGESFSTHQAWMEGALEHADEMLDKFFL